MIPWSWALQYLSQINSAPMTNERKFWDSEQIPFLEALKKTVFTLCQMVKKSSQTLRPTG